MHAARPDSIVVGRVVAIWRYPVKSMAGEPLEDADVSWHGVAGDRRWAFVRDGVVDSGFPWLTIRQRREMWHYRPRFVEPSRPDRSRTLVATPDGQELDVTDAALAEALAPGSRVIRQDRGVFDTFPLSLISTRSIHALGERVGQVLDPRRFRPNLLVEVHDDVPFPEDAWVGGVLRVGGLRVRMDKRDGRCAVITVDPDSLERDAAVLRRVLDEREGCLGIYGSTVEPGRVSVGDAVVLETAAAVGS